MNMSNEKLMRLAGRALKRTESYQWNRGLDVPDEENYKIDYLLVKGSKETALQFPSGISYAVPVRHLHELIKSVQTR